MRKILFFMKRNPYNQGINAFTFQEEKVSFKLTTYAIGL